MQPDLRPVTAGDLVSPPLVRKLVRDDIQSLDQYLAALLSSRTRSVGIVVADVFSIAPKMKSTST
jgi:hypothetical protein